MDQMLEASAPETALAVMMDTCEQLSRETHFEGLLTRALDILHNTFLVQRCALMRIISEKGELQFSSQVLPVKGSAALCSEHEVDLKLRLKQSDLKQADYTEGLNHITLGEQPYHFALLGEATTEWYLLIWEAQSQSEENAAAWSAAQSTMALEFFVRHIQGNIRWQTRLSETQTLLHIDDLTGLYNHRYMDLAIDREIKRAQRYNATFSLLFIDLDDFKPINDKYGHLAGSQALRDVAQILRTTVRDVDLVFRYGGDEFVVLLIESDARTGLKTAQRIGDRIQQTAFDVQQGGAIAKLTASIGVANYPEHGDEKERLIALADECMYESKRHGKNQVVLVGAPRVGPGLPTKEGMLPWFQK